MDLKTVDGIITGVIQREGAAFTNRPTDSGGPTRYGVTQAALARYRMRPVTADDVASLRESEARQIYMQDYVYGPDFHLLLDFSRSVAVEVIDTGVNMGPQVAATFLQRCLNVFNSRGTYYPDLLVDGLVGPTTARALMDYVRRRGKDGERVLVRALNHLQGARYIELAEKREANEEYVYGWIKERTETFA